MLKIRGAMDKFLNALIVISTVFLGVALVLYTINSLARLFKVGVPWIEEYCIYSVVFIVFLIQAKLEFRDEHLSIAFLAEKVKNNPIPRRILFTIRGIVSIVVYVILFKEGLAVIQQNLSYGVVSPILSFPMGIYFTLINICFVLVIIYWIVHIFTKKWTRVDEQGVKEYA
ncbi:MAG: TRAP transporter small permease [Clostridiales bacterium]|nr:TRAP transporter small permease [Clostridiales bacterium]